MGTQQHCLGADGVRFQFEHLRGHFSGLLGETRDTEIFADLDGYRQALCGTDSDGIALNLVSLVGHAALRFAVMGYEDRPATAEEREAMCDLLEIQLRQGAAGLSTGLAYPPAKAATTGEILSLVRDVADRAGEKVTLTEVTISDAVDDVTTKLRPHAIVRALENLVGNALRYGHSCEMRISVTERAIRISVEDDGPGIPEDLREEALKPFSRLDKSRNQDRGTGVGLGLAIAQDIARRHGGSLFMGESERLGGLKIDLVMAR